MEEILGDSLHCEEQLRTTLHCDDKEKLRRKLVLLQREYLRTAQRLQRAERSEAVRKHVRSRITRQDHRDPEITSNSCLRPSPLTLNTTKESASGGPQSQDHTGGPAESENSKRSQEIRFFLPADAPTPQTPDPRPSPALRLRSRRSRLRWEQRSAEAGRSSENSEEGPEQSERVEAAASGETEGGVRTEVVDESEEVCSGTDSECSSLLLTHWNTNTGQTETGSTDGREIRDGQEQREKEAEFRPEGKESESPSLLLTCGKPAINTGGLRHDAVQNGGREEEEGENSRKERDEQLCEDSNNEDCKQNAAEQTERGKSQEDAVEEKQAAVGVLDSCTLVEGLPFPAEYYVRTTRRMTSSQSQPDLQAVILSQLSVGRPRRSRGHGRGQRRRTAGQRSDGHAEADFSSLTAASPSAGPHKDSQEADTSAELTSQSSSGTSGHVSSCQVDTDTCSPNVTAPRSARGRQRRRGRGRGRPQTPRCSLTSDAHQTSDDPQTTSFLGSSSPSLHGADGTNPSLSPGGAGPVPDDPQPATSHSASSLPSSGANKAQSTSSGQQVYPIFVKCSSRTNRSSQTSQGAASVTSLLLPSSPPVQTSLLPLPSPSLGSLVNSLRKFDIPLDFHLPDEQFASLKLHKLRQVAVEAGAEHLASPSYNTRRSIQRYNSIDHGSHAATPPLSLTPTITNSSHHTEVNQATAQLAELENQQADTLPMQVLESPDGEDPTEQPTGNLQCQTHPTSTESASLVQDCAADCVDRYSEKDQDQGSTNHQAEEEGISKTLSFDYPPQKPPEEPSTGCPAAEACNDGEAPGESPVQRLHVKSPTTEAKESPEPAVSLPRPNKDQDKCLPAHTVDSQLLMSPPPASAPHPFLSPHVCSSALPVSPILPSLGLTPLPLNSSPTAPALILPPPHSPSTQALSPPTLSPCPSLPPSQPPTSPVGQIRPLSEPPQRAAPVTCPADSAVQSQGSDGKEHKLRCTHTLKAPAGGCLVDACCLPGSSGGLWVAAAGKWAVCLWSQTSASDWSLTHTWAFNEPVISVFAVPDAAGLICVTLGQLEIREVRILSCSSLLQVQLCGGMVQAVVGVSRSRVVTSSHSASGSTLQVFSLSDCGSTHSSQPLVAPGVCVGALSPVDGLSDALIGTDEGGCLFIWNLKTGQLLQRILLGDGLWHTACLRGYSSCGVLFVLLQHQLLSSPEEEKRAAAAATGPKVLEEEEVKRKTVLFSLVAVNPLTGKSVRAARLYPPKAWTGRLCEADVSSSSVVGLSQTGCVCAWELGRLGDSGVMVWAPEGEGWQLARWGGGGTLVTGLHDGDVTLHCYSASRTSLCR